MNNYTISAFRRRFPNDRSCLDYLLQSRYGNTCPLCEQSTKFYKLTKRNAYSCGRCRGQVYPLADTIFHKSRTSLWSWFYGLYIFSVSKNGVSAAELQRHIGVTYKCAWRMANRIRSLMVQPEQQLQGTTEADEVYIGGRLRGHGGYGSTLNKSPVLGVVERGGSVRAKTTDYVTTQSVGAFMQDTVQPDTALYTDGKPAYRQVGRLYDHQSVNHSKKEYARGKIHTNTIEGFWSHLQLTLSGTYRSVSKQHLQSYVDECVFHYNRDNPAVFMELLERIVPVTM